jgi:hypothetical protein
VDDHFWPAMYPGIIVGMLVGLTGGGFLSTMLGAAGGLAGTVGASFVLGWTGIANDIVSLAALIGGAAIGAYGAMTAAARVRQALSAAWK